MPNTPPLPGTSSRTSGSASATSSPNTRMRSSSAICSCSVRRMASPNVTTSVPSGAGGGGEPSPGSGNVPTTWSTTEIGAGRGDASASSAAARTAALASARICSATSGFERAERDQALLERRDRVVLALVVELFGDAVLLLVVRERMRVRTGDECVDETRPGAGAHVRDRVRSLAPHLEVVAAVHLHDPESADAAHHLRDRRRMLVGRSHGDRVAVVGDDEQHGEVQPGRGVERFPELAFRRRAFAERYVRQLVALCGAAGQVRPPADVARRLRAADRGQALARGHRRLADDVQPCRSPVTGHLAPARCGVGRRADRLQQHLERGDTEGQGERAVAVVREEPVVVRRAGRARARAAMPRAPRPRSGRTPGSAGAARSRGRRGNATRARVRSRRAPRRDSWQGDDRVRRRALASSVRPTLGNGDGAREPAVAATRAA